MLHVTVTACRQCQRYIGKVVRMFNVCDKKVGLYSINVGVLAADLPEARRLTGSTECIICREKVQYDKACEDAAVEETRCGVLAPHDRVYKNLHAEQLLAKANNSQHLRTLLLPWPFDIFKHVTIEHMHAVKLRMLGRFVYVFQELLLSRTACESIQSAYCSFVKTCNALPLSNNAVTNSGMLRLDCFVAIVTYGKVV